MADTAIETVFLVPGFMSPAWMMYPLDRYLRATYPSIVRWDYPRVFADLDRTISKLANHLESYPNRSVAIVAHSFGDWIVRSALNRVQRRSTARLVSICPVVRPVPVAQIAHRLTGDLIPEFAVMASHQQTSLAIPEHLCIDRRNIWAKGELLVRQPDDATPDRCVWASHNSVLFQPNVWRVIADELAEPLPDHCGADESDESDESSDRRGQRRKNRPGPIPSPAVHR